MKLKNQYEHSENQHWALRKCLLENQAKNLQNEIQIYKKKQWEVKEKVMYEEFDRIMKNIRITICYISASLITEHKIVIYLFKKYITKSEKQWLENESYLFLEFLQRVRALKNQVQKKYNQYKSDLHSERYVSAESNKYVKLILNKKSQWFKNLWRKTNEIKKTKNYKLSQKD